MADDVKGGGMSESNRDGPEGDDALEALARSRAEQGSPGAGEDAKAKPASGFPGWFRFAMPMLFVGACVLLGIGGWACGAVIYMQRVTPMAPEDVQYPLLRWSDEVGTSGGYSPESRMMAMAMLGCIPLAVIMVVMGIMLRRQLRGPKKSAVGE